MDTDDIGDLWVVYAYSSDRSVRWVRVPAGSTLTVDETLPSLLNTLGSEAGWESHSVALNEARRPVDDNRLAVTAARISSVLAELSPASGVSTVDDPVHTTPWSQRRPFTGDELRRIGNGDTSLYRTVPFRNPTIAEEPMNTDAARPWSRQLAQSPRSLAKWAGGAIVSSAAQRHLWKGHTGELFFVEGDAATIIIDAADSILDSNRQTPDRPFGTALTMESAPCPIGHMSFAEPIHVLGRPDLTVEVAVGWRMADDFRDQNTGAPLVYVDVYYRFEDSSRFSRICQAFRATMDVLRLPMTPDDAEVDPGDGLRRGVDPDSPLAQVLKLIVLSAAVAVIVAGKLIEQGGIIETHKTGELNVTRNKGKQRARHRKLDDVEIVKIRRTYREVADALRNAVEGDENAPDAHSFRWVVSGHWRNQPHGPGGSLRRPVYIEPHLKGPDGAPIRRRPRVFLL